MNTAKQLLNLVEAVEKAVTSQSDLKTGDSVMFVKGHDLEGVNALVNSFNPDGTINVMVGKSVRVSVPLKDIVKIALHPGILEPSVSTTRP